MLTAIALHGALAAAWPVAAQASARWVVAGVQNPSGDAWLTFWRLVRERFGYELPVASGRAAIGDDGLPSLEYVRLLREAGFSKVDIVQRTSAQLTIAAVKE